MTLIDTGLTVADAIEAEARKVMATRAGLKHKPGTHALQADLLVDLDYLLDQWLEADGKEPAPHA